MNPYESVARAKLSMSLKDVRNQLVWLRREHPEEQDLVEILRKLKEIMLMVGARG